MYLGQGPISRPHLAFVGLDPFGLDGPFGSQGHKGIQLGLQKGNQHFAADIHGLKTDIGHSDQQDALLLLAIVGGLHFFHVIHQKPF